METYKISSILFLGCEGDSYFWELPELFCEKNLPFKSLSISPDALGRFADSLGDDFDVIFISGALLVSDVKETIEKFKCFTKAEIILAGLISNKDILAQAYSTKVCCYLQLPDEKGSVLDAAEMAIQMYHKNEDL